MEMAVTTVEARRRKQAAARSNGASYYTEQLTAKQEAAV